MFLFIDMPCLMKKVAGCWNMTANMSNVVQIGKSSITTFKILTRWLLLLLVDIWSVKHSVSVSPFMHSGLSSSLEN
ncbi:hypothetical protein Hanom_Chr14g01305791 [Helianthus anomalus]